jgi:hypothetical protein
MDFTGFDKVFPNSVYAIHDYCGFGFPNRIGRFQGRKEQEQYIRQMYDRKVAFMKKHNVPIWNGRAIERTPCAPGNANLIQGEFGPIYEREEYNPDWEVHNEERYNMLDRQLAIYTSESIGKHPNNEYSSQRHELTNESMVNMVIQRCQRDGYDVPST